MEVRWRLFARDVLSLPADDAGEFRFGRPPRPVRGLRLLGVVVHRRRGSGTSAADSRRAEDTAQAEAGVTGYGKKRARGSGSGSGGGGGGSNGDGSAEEGEFGLLGIDDGTGVVEVRLPLRLWEAVALSDQLDIVGSPERTRALNLAPASSGPSASADRSSRPAAGVRIKADGCFTERDPNVATLRALECINLYKACYFSRAWSPSAVPLPAPLPDPQGTGSAGGGGFVGANSNGAGGGAAAGTTDAAGAAPQQLHAGRSGGGAESAPSLEGLLGLIGSMGGATADQLAANLGLSPGHAGVASALDQMQLDGAIYLAGDRYMPL